MPEFMTREDLAKIGVTYSDLYLRRLEKNGDFPRRVKIGKTVKWVKADVHKYIDNKIQASRS
jgi:predicted DNA-binding transcriptional regulator AlpA